MRDRIAKYMEKTKQRLCARRWCGVAVGRMHLTIWHFVQEFHFRKEVAMAKLWGTRVIPRFAILTAFKPLSISYQ
jgi:hypothetical protein